jgi:ubiquinone/menaquinone biosynthesis C-methylase UbiE
LISNNWETEDGVVKTSSHPSYWNLLPPDEMETFLKEVKAKSWKTAINSSNNPKIKNQYLFTDCPSRADGTLYLSLTKESRVLDLGSGWGSYTFALSPKVKEIVAADSSLESLKFISLRAKEEDRKNLSTVQIDPLDYGKLPFKDNSFDAVILNGVLEWVGSYLKAGDPLKIQNKCLKEINRILKPGGELWIGIENRFGLRYFLGAGDDHLKYYTEKKIAYTTIVPRIIASFITQKEIKMPYRTYTHSLPGLERLLKRSGFEELNFYYPESDYRADSTKIIPLNSKEVSRSIKNRIPKNSWLGIFPLFGLEKALCDSYFVSARKRR